MRAERFKVVSVLDEALDLDFHGRLAYAGSRDWDTVKNRIVPGMRATVFHVREVPHVLWEEYVDAPDSFPEKYKRAFMCGVEKVEHLVQRDGVAQTSWAPNTKNVRSGAFILSEDDLQLFSAAERAEIGSVIYTHSFLPLKMRAPYLLPHTLQEPLLSQAAHLVAQRLAAAEVTSSAEQSAHSTPPQTVTEPMHAQDGGDSGKATDATAAIQINP